MVSIERAQPASDTGEGDLLQEAIVQTPGAGVQLGQEHLRGSRGAGERGSRGHSAATLPVPRQRVQKMGGAGPQPPSAFIDVRVPALHACAANPKPRPPTAQLAPHPSNEAREEASRIPAKFRESERTRSALLGRFHL
jgi:hypothetical protein